MTFKHREKSYEDELTAHLIEAGWLPGNDRDYDRARALYPNDLLDWVRETQPKEWQKLVDRYGSDAGEHLLDEVVKQLEKRGTLWLLRNSFKDVNARIQLCQFKPSHGFNPEVAPLYTAVRCRVVRQVRYSRHNGNSIDLVLFVNGLPVATLELKTDFTQNINDAIRQYKFDRPPRDPNSRAEEPLLAFKRGALVHFAVSTDEVYMTTRLAGADTYFLPFNQGDDQGAGNPANPYGYRTAYLWERILQRDGFLEILGRFASLEQKTEENELGRKRVKETLIFPRFHQWEAVTKLVATVRAEGPGQRYLIQHSAGSGKSNSIAWLAHALSSLHDARDTKLFDSVIVVTDRTVLDKQLQETIYQIEHKEGVVIRITDRETKSQQLAKALAERAPVIIVTIQTFPHVLEAIQQQGGLRERAYAVIADEAHSSQSGSTATWLKRVLTAEQIEEGEEVGSDDLLVAAMEARQQPQNVSFFAFTATPKSKTIELFGRKGADGLPAPFHVYSMQQAIEEGFILDVLRNYLPYRVAWRLAHNGHSYEDTEVEQREGLKQLARWVRLTPHNIRAKAEILVEHFREQVYPLLDRNAKAMVVTGSRKEAVRFALAVRAYVAEHQYPFGVMVAFSGEVSDPESGEGAFSEVNMNDLRGQELRAAFDQPGQQILIVANKYQTGFDQPKLVAMYVDKKLAGVNAVQTLSRLNRTYRGKTDTFVLDFVNNPDEILASFLPYFRTAELREQSDPNVLHELQIKLDDAHIYTSNEVDAFARAYFDPKGKQEQLQRHVAPAVDRWREAMSSARDERDRAAEDELLLFAKDLGNFVRAYDFLAQIFHYDDPDLEKRSVYYRHLAPWLKIDRRSSLIDLSEVELTHYRAQELGKRALVLKDGGDEYKLPGAVTAIGTGAAQDPLMASLGEIIEQLNSLFTGDNLSENDLVTYARHISGKLLENDRLAVQANNTKEQFAIGAFRDIFEDTIYKGLDSYKEMAGQVLGNNRTRKGFERLVLDIVYKEFKNRRETMGR